MTGRAVPELTALLVAFAVGVIGMGLLQWHVHAHWLDLYVLHPMYGYSTEVLARDPPDYLSSDLSRRTAMAFAAIFSLLLVLFFAGRAALAAAGFLAGAWLVPATLLVLTPGSFSSNLGPLAVLVNFMFSAGLLGVAVLAGALPGALVNALRARLARSAG